MKFEKYRWTSIHFKGFAGFLWTLPCQATTTTNLRYPWRWTSVDFGELRWGRLSAKRSRTIICVSALSLSVVCEFRWASVNFGEFCYKSVKSVNLNSVLAQIYVQIMFLYFTFRWASHPPKSWKFRFFISRRKLRFEKRTYQINDHHTIIRIWLKHT